MAIESQRLFDLSVPIIQAPMAGVATPALAAAVSNAGGLGSLGLGSSTVDQARAMISQTRALTSRSFNVNLFCHQPAERDAARETAWIEHLSPLFRETGADIPASLNESRTSFLADEAMMQLLLELRPPVVSFHFGVPSPERMDAFRASGILMIGNATNVNEANLLVEAGVDAIVAQGIEAGGHRGVFDPDDRDERLPTQVLVRLPVQSIGIPVIAAGGIMDGHGIRAAMALGAAGVQMGTAFILCPESAASEGYRNRLKSERAWSTQLTSVPSGRPARGLVNRLISYGEAPGSPRPAAFPLAFDASKQLSDAALKHGNDDFAAYWAGQGAPLARELPAAELMRQLSAEMVSPRSE
jgi:nitronate monooxygenase